MSLLTVLVLLMLSLNKFNKLLQCLCCSFKSRSSNSNQICLFNPPENVIKPLDSGVFRGIKKGTFVSNGLIKLLLISVFFDS